jgi:hypothetical protein
MAGSYNQAQSMGNLMILELLSFWVKNFTGFVANNLQSPEASSKF